MRDVCVLRHVPFEGPGILTDILQRRGARLSVRDVAVDPDWMTAASKADLLVVLGGPINVDQTELFPFLALEREILRTRMQEDGPLLGICLGAQIMARALDVPVEPGPVEVGWKPISLTPTGQSSVLSPLHGVPVLHWHGDHVAQSSELPSLAQTDVGAVQAFTRGRALGLQFHLEVEAAALEAWYVGHAAELGIHGISVTELREQAERWTPRLAPLARTVCENWLDSL